MTPKSYMSFLDGFRSLYSTKLAETRELAGAINNGLQKMDGAKIDVNRMKVHRLGNLSLNLVTSKILNLHLNKQSHLLKWVQHRNVTSVLRHCFP